MSRPVLAALTISSVDAVIVVVYVAAVTLMGIWIGRDNKDVSDYLLGNRNMPWWAVLGSIVATETSTATFLSVPGIAFAKDGNFSFLQLAFGYVIGRILVSIWLLPLYFKGQLFTAYEVLHKRFGGLTQKTASLIFLVTRNLGDSLRLFLTAIVVKQVTGLSLTTSIIVVGVSTIAYTSPAASRARACSELVTSPSTAKSSEVTSSVTRGLLAKMMVSSPASSVSRISSSLLTNATGTLSSALSPEESAPRSPPMITSGVSSPATIHRLSGERVFMR